MGGGGRGLGRLVSLSCDEDGDNSDNKGKQFAEDETTDNNSSILDESDSD
jgi:hypothetical protein